MSSSTYQVIARKYRPKSFEEVLGQEAIVTTLKNAIKYQRLAHAYLFCGSRGTGKTTLARVFAKALNCQSPTPSGEPCSLCSSCKEIASGSSLDVLEIDGASNRGIDDIRQINDTVGYSSSYGKYKIYIIDEVHMLTKEAFNALLKTLEEPPKKVLFLFATTEPHKVLPTILSRCQRFNLNRIPKEKIIEKLRYIAEELKVDVEQDALQLLAERADGGLRDAESLFDQIIAFHENKITAAMVADVLGVMPKSIFFAFDQAGKEGRLSAVFEMTQQLFAEGKDMIYFAESLTDHFRTLVLVKISGVNAPFLNLLESDKIKYEASAKLYSHEQCITILEYLADAQIKIRSQVSPRIFVETILLHIMRTHQRLPVEFLVRRLAELEQAVKASPQAVIPVEETNAPQNKKELAATFVSQEQSRDLPRDLPGDLPRDLLKDSGIKDKPDPVQQRSPAVAEAPDRTACQAPVIPQQKGIQVEQKPQTVQQLTPQKQSRYDTVMQFAAVELKGKLQKKS